MNQRTGLGPRQPRLAVLHPYWDFWEHTAPPGFREERGTLIRALADQFGDMAEITTAALIDSTAAAAAVAAQLETARPDAILIPQSMAAPPTHVLPVLDRFADVPIIVWAVHDIDRIDEAFDHGSITLHGATVGAPMLTNVLIRRGRPFRLVMGPAADPITRAAMRERLTSALAAGRVRRARIGRVGQPLEGYLHVDCDQDELAASMGIDVVEIHPQEVLESYGAVPEEVVSDLEAEVRARWRLAPDVHEGEGLLRSLRLAAAMERIVVDNQFDAGAMNCHVPQIRFSEEIGVTPCFGLGRLTSAGIPWTCTGDLVTAVAMLSLKRLGGAALYQELEAVDYETGEVVIANSGEHDLAWLAPGEQPRLERNRWFCGSDPRCGVCAVLEPTPGPASLVGFTPHSSSAGGFRYIVARGELTTRRFPQTGTSNGAFRFAEGSVVDAWVRWAEAGVNHHSAATPGDYADAVVDLANHLGVGCVIV